MVRNPSYPGPYTLEIDYFTTINSRSLKHTNVVNCVAVGSPVPGTAATSILLATAGGGTKTLADAAAQWWSFYRLLLPTSTTAGAMSLYRITPNTSKRTFIQSVVVLPATGAVANAPLAAREDTLTFRSGKGKWLTIDAQETSNANDTQVPLTPNAGGSAQQRVAAYMLSADCVLSSRDRSFPVGAMNYSNTQNEAIYRKRFRSS